MSDNQPYVLDVWTEPSEDALFRVVGLLRRHLVAVTEVTMRDRAGKRHVELSVTMPEHRLPFVCQRLENLVDVLRVVSWRFSQQEPASA